MSKVTKAVEDRDKRIMVGVGWTVGWVLVGC